MAIAQDHMHLTRDPAEAPCSMEKPPSKRSSMEEPTILSFCAFRLSQLVQVSKPTGIMSVAVGGTILLRTALAGLPTSNGLFQTLAEVLHVALFTAVMCLPALTVATGRLEWLRPACMASHVIRSWGLWCVGIGLAPFVGAIRSILHMHIELLVEAALAIPDKLSLPTMAGLHALRQLAWMSILIWRMGGDPYHAIPRGVLNWICMMMLSCMFELRTWTAYQKQCAALKQRKGSPGLPRPATALPTTDEQALHFASARPAPVKAVTAAGQEPAAAAAHSRSQQVFHSPATPSTPTPTVSMDESASARGMMVSASRAPPAGLLSGFASGSIQHEVLQSEVLQIIERQHKLRYKRNRRLAPTTMHVKVKGVELEQLPPDLPRLLHKQLHVCMPGMDLAGLAMRSGCVVLTMDLLKRTGLTQAPGADALSGVSLADGMTELINSLMQSNALGQMLEDGTTLCIQTRDEFVLRRWDSSMSSYMSVESSSEALSSLDQAGLTLSRLSSAFPVIHCLPSSMPNAPWTGSAGKAPAPAATSPYRISLTVQLQLPSSCRLHGWQPTGMPYLPASGVLVQTNGVQEATVVSMDAMLMVRCMGGDYLPVTVEHVSRLFMGDLGEPMTYHTTAQVVVTLSDVSGPAVLCLELWCTKHSARVDTVLSGVLSGHGDSDPHSPSWLAEPCGAMCGSRHPSARNSSETAASFHTAVAWAAGEEPGLELLVSHMPLMVLPGRWKEAAAELQQHVESLGGVQPKQVRSPLTRAVSLDASACTAPEKGYGFWSPPLTPPQFSANLSSSLTAMSTDDRAPIAEPLPVNVPASDAACCLLEDLGMWMRHHHCPPAAVTGEPVGAPDDVMTQLGDDLLVYAVQHGLVSVAGLIVGTMQLGEQLGFHGSSLLGSTTAPGPMHDAPSAWLLRVTGSPTPATSTAAGRDDDDDSMSLLHAAVASGQRTTLAQVLRWGTLYGGRDWAWPWALEDATGCTALHLAAAQPTRVCLAMLETLTNMLPSAQLQAARNAWLHSQGSMGTTPAELFALACNCRTVGNPWAAPATQLTSPGHLVATRSDHAVFQDSPRDGGLGGPSSPIAAEGSPRSAAGLPQYRVRRQSWINRLVELWSALETDEYRAWAKEQTSGLVCIWATCLSFIGVVAVCRSAWGGCQLHEVLYLALFTAGYIPIMAISNGVTFLGDAQAWMLATHIAHSAAYALVSFMPSQYSAMWAGPAAKSLMFIYEALLIPVGDQTPLHQLLIVRVVECHLHSLAYSSMGHSLPLGFVLAMHVCGLAATILWRAKQLKEHRRWQAEPESDLAAPSDDSALYGDSEGPVAVDDTPFGNAEQVASGLARSKSAVVNNNTQRMPMMGRSKSLRAGAEAMVATGNEQPEGAGPGPKSARQWLMLKAGAPSS